jgi:DNA-binding response OmpR family regulator
LTLSALSLRYRELLACWSWPVGSGGLMASDRTPDVVAGKLQVGLLGPLEVSVDGQPVVVTARRLRTLLAVLAMSAGRTVPVDRLAMAAWGEELPGDARKAVQTYLSRLRRLLGAGLIAP